MANPNILKNPTIGLVVTLNEFLFLHTIQYKEYSQNVVYIFS